MQSFVMSLERRVLFAGVSDALVLGLQQTVQDAYSIVGDISGAAFQVRADYQAIARDLRGQTHTAAERKLLAAAMAAGRKDFATIEQGYFRVIRAGLADGRAAFANGTRIVNGSSDASLAARLLNELTRLQTETAVPLAALLAAAPSASAAFSNSLASLAAAFPNNASLQTDIQTAKTDAGTAVSTIQADAATAQSDVSALITDLTS